jgi:acyl carrier protein
MNRDLIVSVVKRHIAASVDGANESTIDLHKSMKDYGASSLDIVSVVSGVMRELKVKIPRSELKHIDSIGGLVDMFAANAAPE